MQQEEAMILKTCLYYKNIKYKNVCIIQDYFANMASTRFINSKGEFALEQRMNSSIVDNRLYEQRTLAYDTRNSTFGVFDGRRPNYTLSRNATDVESQLYGIGSTNLVNPRTPVRPRSITNPDITFFKRPNQHFPNPLVIEKCQRPVIP